MWPRARITVMLPAITVRTLCKVFSLRSLVEPLQHLPRTLPSLHCSLTALPLIVGASSLDQPLQDLEVTTAGCNTGRSSIPRTALAPRPAQDLQATTAGCSIGHFFIPRTALAPRPAQDLQVTMKSSVLTNTRVPRAGRVLTTHPLEHLKLTATSSLNIRPSIPRTPLRPQPLEHLQMAMKSSPTTSIFVPQLAELFLWPLAPVLLKHLEVAVGSRDVENSLDEFRIGVVLIELPAPVRAPVLREEVHTVTKSRTRSRHELPARQHLRLSQLLGHQSKGAHVILIELPRDDRPHLRRKLDLSLVGVGALPPSLRGMADHVARSLALRRLVSVAPSASGPPPRCFPSS